MPEGPEVLVTGEGLHIALVGKSITMFEIAAGRYVKNPPPNFSEFQSYLPVRVDDVEVKGKLIIFHLSSTTKKWWILNSLRMTGKWSKKCDKYTKIIVTTSDGEKIFFSDVRNFATLEFISDKQVVDKTVNSLAPGFIGRDQYLITYKEFYERIGKCKAGRLVSKLMDQKSICSGIGNYLLSEIMYAAGIDRKMKCNELSSDDKERLFKSCKKIIIDAYSSRGMSMKNYKNIEDETGQYSFKLEVYNKTKTSRGETVLSEKGYHGRRIWFVPRSEGEVNEK